MSKDEPGTASRFKDQYFLSVSVCLKPRPHRSVCLRPGCGIVVRVEQEVRTQCRDTSRNERIQVIKVGVCSCCNQQCLIYIYIYIRNDGTGQYRRPHSQLELKLVTFVAVGGGEKRGKWQLTRGFIARRAANEAPLRVPK